MVCFVTTDGVAHAESWLPSLNHWRVRTPASASSRCVASILVSHCSATSPHSCNSVIDMARQVDVDVVEEALTTYGVSSLPTMVVFDVTSEVTRVSGVQLSTVAQALRDAGAELTSACENSFRPLSSLSARAASSLADVSLCVH